MAGGGHDDEEGGHHGGAWKVAYADFVTAMMAFFLLMWLISATTEEQKRGISDYFDPKIPLSRTTTGGIGLFYGESLFSTEKAIKDGTGGDTRSHNPGDDGDKSMQDNFKPGQSSLAEGGKRNRDGKASQTIDGASLVAGTHINDNAELIAESATAALPMGEPAQEPIDDEVLLAFVRAEVEAYFGRSAVYDELADHFRFSVTPEGIRIDLVDRSGSPLFEAGAARMTPRGEELLRGVAAMAADTTNRIALTGHTDATPVTQSAAYSNWELSTERALAARQILQASGVAPSRLQRIEGRAATQPLPDVDPLDPANRRVGIILLRETGQSDRR